MQQHPPAATTVTTDTSILELLSASQVDIFVASQEEQAPIVHKLWSSEARLLKNKLSSFMAAGFSREEAFRILLNDRK